MSRPGRPRVLAVIPARFASQRLPGKPLADIGGRPMIVHVIERVRRARSVDEILVATDDRRILAAVEGAGCRAVMTSPALRSGTDRIAAAVRAEEPEADIIVNVQGDEPLLPPAMIDQAVGPLVADPAIEAGTLVKRVESLEELRNPSIPKVVLDREGYCLYFSRSVIPHLRDLPEEAWLARGPFYRHIGIYVFRRDFLLTYAAMAPTPLEQAEKLEQLRILEQGHRIRAAVTELESIAVDTPEDLERVRALAAAQPAYNLDDGYA
ncbi:MAG TPA: 3-deoxy-manno-octulosonate cytidylyltransferase [Bacteroidota bacterium]